MPNEKSRAYRAGEITADIVWYVGGARIIYQVYRVVNVAAKVHKIDNSNPDAVTENVFDCLEHID